MRESPESLMMPYEGEVEVHPTITLELCDKCKWSCSLLSTEGNIEFCPVCNTAIGSHIPMTAEEVCRIEIDDEQGLIFEFDRKMLLK